MTNQEVEQLETADTSYQVELYEALERLENNEDFKKVILEGYLATKPLGLVTMLARHDVKQRGERPNVMEELIAVSSLGQYLFMIKQLGGSAKVDLEDGRE
jgi:hypothetical protein|nr:MAG TPA: hypothetical protein [Caudoviricetes sp.]DAW45254.1 MAG TPA: hypothetical protein [Caudoviricetes sp.]